MPPQIRTMVGEPTCTLAAALALACAVPVAGQDPVLDGYTRSPWFGEQVRELTPAEGVRAVVNVPRTLDPGVPIRVVLFATPNGNTIEQTLGCRAAPGLDWHYDIQHVAAQVRRLREMASNDNVVLVCLEADGLSWPAWRARQGGAGAGARDLVTRVLRALPPGDFRIDLCAHSGGGSLLWAFVEDGGSIPPMVERIVFLDANYGYSSERGHLDELLGWLGRSARNRLVVVAYDDREIELEGKKVVGPTGGTFRASERMIADFGKHLDLARTSDGDLECTKGLDGRFTVLRHANPDNRILHTALVGDMNGVLWALALGEDYETAWGKFGGPRAYSDWIQPVPGTGAESTDVVAAPRVLPPRPADAPGGRAVLESVARLSLFEREARIEAEVEAGNVPEFLRRPVVVELEADDGDGNTRRIRYRVAPDYLAVGSDTDFVRVPLTPMAAQRVADRFGLALPTRKMVGQIHAHAGVRLEPRPMGEPRQAVATFLEHERLIEEQRAGRALGALVAGVKKDIVVTPRLAEKPGKVAIFGWHHPDGRPIQPLYLGHIATYVDYSHGVRLVWPVVDVDGRETSLSAALADPKLHVLLSDEGPVTPDCQRYRTR